MRYLVLFDCFPPLSLPGLAVDQHVLQGQSKPSSPGQARSGAMAALLHSRLMSLNLYSQASILCLIQSLLFPG